MNFIHWRHRLPTLPKATSAYLQLGQPPIANEPPEECICFDLLDKLSVAWGNPCSLCWPLLLTSASLPPPGSLFLSSLFAFIDRVSFCKCLQSLSLSHHTKISTLCRKPSVMQIFLGSLCAETWVEPFPLLPSPLESAELPLDDLPPAAQLRCQRHLPADFLLDSLSANDFRFHKFDTSVERG